MKLKTSENPFFAAAARIGGLFARQATYRFVDVDTGEAFHVSDRRLVPDDRTCRFEGIVSTPVVGFDANAADNDASVLAYRGSTFAEEGGQALLKERVHRADLRIESKPEDVEIV